MPSINDVYQSAGANLTAADLQGKKIPVTITEASIKEFDKEGGGKDRKIHLAFEGKEKGLIVNKTNAATIAEIHGDDYERWVGGVITIYPTKVQFGSDMVDAIRVELPIPEESGDDIGF